MAGQLSLNVPALVAVVDSQLASRRCPRGIRTCAVMAMPLDTPPVAYSYARGYRSPMLAGPETGRVGSRVLTIAMFMDTERPTSGFATEGRAASCRAALEPLGATHSHPGDRPQPSPCTAPGSDFHLQLGLPLHGGAANPPSLGAQHYPSN